ncbi:hypothetical protein BX666DRAFT_1889455 [Dichotomocladium elegans]|nr:hypothetical protein BX666DRAFT_1889455 [Dichotomocladium elegans]
MAPLPLQTWQWVLVALGIVAAPIILSALAACCTASSDKRLWWRWRQRLHTPSTGDEKTTSLSVLHRDAFDTLPISTRPSMQSIPSLTIERPAAAWFPVPPLRPPPRRGKLPKLFKPSSSPLGTKSNSPESTKRGEAMNGAVKKMSYIDISWRGPTPPWTMCSSHRDSIRQHHNTSDNKQIPKVDTLHENA